MEAGSSPPVSSSPRLPPSLPASATSFMLNMIGAATALAAFFVLRHYHWSGDDAVLTVCAAGVVPIVLLDRFVLQVHRRESTGLDWDNPGPIEFGRVATKLVGLAATLAPIALAYFVFPEYGDWYNHFWNTLRRFGVSLVFIAIVYVTYVDGIMKDPYDAYWQLGRVILGHPSDARRADIANHYRGWLIKAFYLPLFVVFTNNQINGILTYNLNGASDMRLYHFSSDLIYALDVLYATVGYVLSLRVIDTHLRSAEPTLLGWAVALECYMPFWGRVFSPLYLHYDGIGFEAWLSDHTSIRVAWALGILIFEGIYLLATFAFGVRFSNLTHRGILTTGPYRYTKHPAYIAKNISWWMVTMPLIPYHSSHAGVDAFKSCIGLLGVNFIYFMRARTEERHLSKDPTYVAYALWMNEHGLLRFLNRFSFFRYKPPQPPAEPAPVSAAPAPAVASSAGTASV